MPAADGDDDEYDYTLTPAGRVVLAEWAGSVLLPAAMLPTGYVSRELRARGWLLQPRHQGTCGIIAYTFDPGGQSGTWEICPRSADHEQPPVCGRHWAALRSPHIPA